MTDVSPQRLLDDEFTGSRYRLKFTGERIIISSVSKSTAKLMKCRRRSIGPISLIAKDAATEENASKEELLENRALGTRVVRLSTLPILKHIPCATRCRSIYCFNDSSSL
ncbi:hypothetical protein DOTSEDRAFT_71867 [Dothistroma septosporum NZE10]|uniref:Uncharacterized protein n=1 Tax=Dothistroma septosporum (strain NZE10 / CBS 128990) TaxID=675120 RepID=N1PMP3_DOTSN|nr:hypothetical protein DOTSEDRAFT_71867 [Dothistroma septosporum NZE10]